MALLWIEGFEGFGTGAQVADYLRRKYQYITAGSPYWYAITGRTGGYGIRGNGDGELYSPELTTSDTAIVGVAIQPRTTGSSNFIRLYDDITLGLDFKFDCSTGEITAYRGTTSLGTTSGAGITYQTWAYVEIKAVCSDSVGSVEIKVNGVSKLSLTGVDTKIGTNAYWSRLVIRTSNACYHDDIYWCDGTGSVNNDWIGVRKVLGIYPAGDSATLQWEPSTEGPHYALVDENLDSVGDYVQADTTDEMDLWEYQAISDVGAINGIQINTSCYEVGGKSFELAMPVKSGGIVYDGPAQGVHTLNVRHKVRVVETDPNTSALWTLGNLNAAQFGVKVA